MTEPLRMSGFDLGLDADFDGGATTAAPGRGGVGRRLNFAKSGLAHAVYSLKDEVEAPSVFALSVALLADGTGGSNNQERHNVMAVKDGGGSARIRMAARDNTWLLRTAGNSGIASAPYSDGEFRHFQIVVELGDPATVTWIVDGEEVYSGQGFGAVMDLQSVYIGPVTSSTTASYNTGSADDLVFGESADGQPFGDVLVRAFVPTGDGEHTEWTPLTGPDLHPEVSDWLDDPDDSWIESDAADQKASFTTGADLGNLDVLAVQLQARAWLPDGGTRQLRPFVRIGSTDYPADTLPLGSSPAPVWATLNENPDTDEPWEGADVNGLQVGVESV